MNGYLQTFLKKFFDPINFEEIEVNYNGKKLPIACYHYSYGKDSPYEDKQHATAEMPIIGLLYKSGLYRDFLTEDRITRLYNLLRFHLLRIEKDGTYRWSATFSPVFRKKHPGAEYPGLWFGICWIFERDPAFYLELIKKNKPRKINNWYDYFRAIQWRLLKEKFESRLEHK